MRSQTPQQSPQCLRTIAFLLFFLLMSSPISALQFVLRPGRKQCFSEQIPPSTAVLLAFTVVAGEGTLPVTIQVAHIASSSIILARDSVDNGKFSFRTIHAPNDPHAAANHQALPVANRETGTEVDARAWHLRDDDVPEVDGTNRQIHEHPPPPESNAPDRDLYSFCFGQTTEEGSGLFHLPRLSLGARPSVTSRRVIFDIRTGYDARAPERYKKLAKEHHLSESDKLFIAVHGHVEDIIRRVDEMRNESEYMERINEETSHLVNLFSMASCIFIVGGALVVSRSTQITLRHHKLI
jgi:hypothetical protein